jgi:hypothetical protein
MDSFFTTFLKSKASNTSDYLNKKISFLKAHHIITASLIFHACALMNLLNNNYPVFIFLFFTGYFCTILDKIYADKYDYNSKYIEYYHNVSQWIIIISLYTVFTELYKYKINNLIIILVVILLLLCNINFVLNNYNNKNKCIELWSKCIKQFINKDNIVYLQQFTKYFDDSLIIVYLIVIMTYLYYKN